MTFSSGLLPERKMDWRTLVTSYGFEVLLLLFLINVGLIWPDRLQLAQKYHVTELVPLPSLRHKPLEIKHKAPLLRAKLLPPAPVLTTPKLTVPREVHVARVKPQEVAAPKVIVNTFQAPRLIQTAGGARLARLVRTGEFGSSAVPTINAPIQKVQTGGFGDPNGVKGEGKENAHLTVAKLGSFELPQAPDRETARLRPPYPGTVASAGFGNGIAAPGTAMARRTGAAGKYRLLRSSAVRPEHRRQSITDDGKRPGHHSGRDLVQAPTQLHAGSSRAEAGR